MPKFKTRIEIADEYGIGRKMLDRKLKRAGIELKLGKVSPNEQEVVYKYFGPPKSLESKIRTNKPPHYGRK